MDKNEEKEVKLSGDLSSNNEVSCDIPDYVKNRVDAWIYNGEI